MEVSESNAHVGLTCLSPPEIPVPQVVDVEQLLAKQEQDPICKQTKGTV
jgi:hypothetical protein